MVKIECPEQRSGCSSTRGVVERLTGVRGCGCGWLPCRNRFESVSARAILFFKKFADERKSLIKSPPDSGDPCKELREYVRKWAERVGKGLDSREFDNIEFSYMEVYPDGSPSNLFSDWLGERGVSRAIRRRK